MDLESARKAKNISCLEEELQEKRILIELTKVKIKDGKRERSSLTEQRNILTRERDSLIQQLEDHRRIIESGKLAYSKLNCKFTDLQASQGSPPTLDVAVKCVRDACFLRIPPAINQKLVNTIMTACSMKGSNEVHLE